jgi:hypothetical protein
MGWKNTQDIYRKEAIKRILENIEEATNEELAAALESIEQERKNSYNYCVFNNNEEIPNHDL